MEKFMFNLQRFAPTEGVTITGKTAGGSTLVGNTLSFKQRKKAVVLPSSTGRTTPIDMLADGRTLQNISDIFNSGKGPDCFIAGDYFDITFPSTITMDRDTSSFTGNTITQIDENSQFRVVCLGIDHNSNKEGENRGHFYIGKNLSNKEIAFKGKVINSSNTNAGGWNGSQIKTWLNETFYNALPTDLKDVITECVKYTDNTGGSSDIEANVTATSQKIWFMAEFEVFGTRSKANQYEQDNQMQYEYFQKNLRAKTHYGHTDGSSTNWQLRSPAYDSSTNFCIIRSNGDISTAAANLMGSIVPCFTIGGN